MSIYPPYIDERKFFTMRVISGFRSKERQKKNYTLRKQNVRHISHKWGIVGAVMLIAISLFFLAGSSNKKTENKSSVVTEQEKPVTENTIIATPAESEILKRLQEIQKNKQSTPTSGILDSDKSNNSDIDLRGYKMISYKIKKGDHLTGIAKIYNTSTNKIIKANPGMDSRSLSVGKSINVPIDRSVNYIVKSGEPVNGIANRFGVDKHELLVNNGLEDARNLRAGMKLVIF